MSNSSNKPQIGHKKQKMQHPHWREHDEFKPAGLEALEDKSKDGPTVYYVLISRLQEGDQGEAFVASKYVGAHPNVEPDENTPKTHVIKRHFARKSETDKETERRVKREFDISKFIALADRVDRGSVCTKNAVCAESFFKYRGEFFTVFPWENAVDMQDFLLYKFYKTFFTDKEYHQVQVAKMALFVCEAVNNLNAHGVYHEDIKPENILVKYTERGKGKAPLVTGIKLIDFGFSCAHFDAKYLELMNPDDKESMLESLDCAREPKSTEFIYRAPPPQRDPLAGVGTARYPAERNIVYPASSVKRLWPLFEMFSCAVLIQCLIDPEQNVAKDTVPVFRTTDRSLPGLQSLIIEMTSSNFDIRTTMGHVIPFLRDLVAAMNIQLLNKK